MSDNVIKPEQEHTGIIKEQLYNGAEAVRSTQREAAAETIHVTDYSSSVAAENRFLQHNGYMQDASVEQRRRETETLDSVRFDGDIDLDREKSREQLGFREYIYETTSDEDSRAGFTDKTVPAYQAERYRPVSIEETLKKKTEATYGEVENPKAVAEEIGGAAGAAAAVGAVSAIVKDNNIRADMSAAVVNGAAETIAADFIKPSQAAAFADQITESTTKNNGLIKTVAGVTGREIAAAIGRGGDELADKTKGQAVKYGYKAGKYALGGMAAGVAGTYRAAKYSKKLVSDVKAGALTGKQARIAALTRGKSKLAQNGASIKKIIKTEIVQGVEDFHGSDDLGMKALTAPKDIYVKTKRTIQVTKAGIGATKGVVRGTAKTVKATAHGAKAAAVSLKKMFSSPVMAKTGLIAGVIIILVAILMAAIAAVSSIIPSISLKSNDKELTRTYEHITKLDAEMTDDIRGIQNSWIYRNIDEFHYYINGSETSAENITIYTNADMMLVYFDTKYDDYAFNKLIHGIFGGTNIKGEVEAIHSSLYSYSTYEWEEEIEHQSTYTDPETGEEVDDSWTETVYHLDINVSVQSFEQYLSNNIDALLTEDEQERYSVISEVGAYTARVELGNPFLDEDYYYVSSRWGWRIHPISGEVKKHTGIDIPKPAGTAINNVMFGTVKTIAYDANGYGNYCIVRSSDGKKEVLYAHMSSVAVSEGQQVLKGDIIGYVGNTGASTGAHLHLEYSIENGFNVNPAFFLDGAAYTGIGSSDIVAVAASQLGNVNGQPYWSWYGFGARVEWCACFVSWCANECGYIEAGIIPKYCGCANGANTFKSRGQWQNGGGAYIPASGDIIFFDWEQDGITDHTGIVESCDGTFVYTIEGNSNNACKRKTYSLYDGDIYGYGIPPYPAD